MIVLPDIQKKAQDLLNELFASSLEVVLIPAPDQRHSGHKIRVVQMANANWYRKFCREHLDNRRRPRTIIKRAETIKALQALTEGKASGIYAERLISFINRNYLKKKFAIEINHSLELWINGKNFMF